MHGHYDLMWEASDIFVSDKGLKKLSLYNPFYLNKGQLLQSQLENFLHSTLNVTCKSNSSILRGAVDDAVMWSVTAAHYMCKFRPPLFPDTWSDLGFKNKDAKYNDSLKCVDGIGDIPYVIRSPCEPWHNLHHPVDAHCTKQAQAHAESAEHS
jgi:hypothetical protein